MCVYCDHTIKPPVADVHCPFRCTVYVDRSARIMVCGFMLSASELRISATEVPMVPSDPTWPWETDVEDTCR
jgi:hypothetical protein